MSTSGISTGLPIDEKIIDDHLAVQAIIRSYQVIKEYVEKKEKKTTKGQSREEAKLLNSPSVPNPPDCFSPIFLFC